MLARDAGLPMILGCAGALPIKHRSVDIVLLSQVAHHLHGDAVMRLARELTMVARVGVVLADLRRSPVGDDRFLVRFANAPFRSGDARRRHHLGAAQLHPDGTEDSALPGPASMRMSSSAPGSGWSPPGAQRMNDRG